jgi:hypothetical protein
MELLTIQTLNSVSRPRNKESTNSFGGLGLDQKEEKALLSLLKDKDISLQKVKRYLIREWIKQQTDPKSGILKLDKL